MADELQREWLRETLIKNRFYWASPTEFNDPFDCSPVYCLPDRPQREAMVARVVREAFPLLNRHARKVEQRRLLRQPPSVLENRLKVDIPALMAESAVYSLASDPDNVLMWSHYANSHEGVCLRFTSKILLGEFPLCSPVTYSKERPIVTVGAENDVERLYEKVVLTKADFWSYEKEWRLSDYRGGRGLRYFPPKSLSGVVLGAKISAANESLIRTWAAERIEPLDILRATFDDRDFRLNVDPA